jgi:hypothetical protein
MGKRRTHKKVDELYHRDTNTTVDLYLTPDNEFYARLGKDDVFLEYSIDALKSAVYKFLSESIQLNFKPIISVEHYTPSFPLGKLSARVGIKIERFWYAQTDKFVIYKLPWERYTETQNISVNLHIAERTYSRKFSHERLVPFCIDGDTYYYPYDESLWTTFIAIKNTIKQENKELADLLSQGTAKIKEFGSRNVTLLDA